MTESPTSTPAEAPKPVRRRASRAAGPASAESEEAARTVATVSVAPTRTEAAASPQTWRAAPPPRRQANRTVVTLAAALAAAVFLAFLGAVATFLTVQNRASATAVDRDQRFVDTASQTVVNMFSYTPDTIEASVNRFIDGTSGPLRDMMSQNNNSENLKAIFRDTNATSEAVVNAAALEAVDEDRGNASVLVAVRVTVTDIDGVNKPSQAYRLRVIVHEDDNDRMTAWDLKYPDGGN